MPQNRTGKKQNLESYIDVMPFSVYDLLFPYSNDILVYFSPYICVSIIKQGDLIPMTSVKSLKCQDVEGCKSQMENLAAIRHVVLSEK